MVKFEKITIRNFLSCGNNDNIFDFEQGLWLFVGENRDEPGNLNGVGKTLLLNAIVYGLYNTIKNRQSRRVKIDNLINNANKKSEMFVEIEFTIGKDKYVLTRTRKKSSNVKLLCNGIDVTTNGISNVDDHIVDIIGIDASLFTTLFCINDGDGLMEQNDAEIKSIIEKVFGLDILRTLADKFKEKRLNCDREITVQNGQLNTLKTQLEFVSTQYKESLVKSEAYTANINLTINKLTDELNKINSVDLDEATNKWDTYITNQLNHENNVQKLNELNKLICKYKNSINNDEATKLSLLNNLNANKEKQAEWSKNKESALSLMSNKLASMEPIDIIKQKMVEFEKQKNTINDKKQDAVIKNNEKINYVSKLENERQVVTNDINNINNKINIYNNDINNIKNSIDSTNKEIETVKSGKCFECNQSLINDDLLNKLLKNLDEYNNKLATINGSILHLNHESEQKQLTVEHYNKLIDDAMDELQSLKLLLSDIENEFSNYSYDVLLNLSNHCKDYSTLFEKINELNLSTNPYDDIVNNFDNTIITKLQESIESNNQQLLIHEADYKINEALVNCYIDEKPILNDVSINALKQSKTNIVNELDKLKSTNNPFIEALDVLKTNEINIKNQYDSTESIINELTNKKNGYNILFKLCSDSDSQLRKAILNQLLGQINERIAHYSTMLSLGFDVFINEELQIVIEQQCVEYDYSLLSGGQRRRLNLSIIFGLIYIYNSVHNPLNVLFLDEVDGGKLANEATAKLISTLYEVQDTHKNCTIIISHSDVAHAKIANHKHIIYEDGFTSFGDE